MERRRGTVVTCDNCNKDFESQESAQLHFLSRNHLQRLLAMKNAPLMGSAAKVNDEVENVQELWGQYLADNSNLTLSDDEGPEPEEMGLMEEIFSCEQEEFSAAQPESDDFFPFPNEKFFLLYCYAHSVMRPKVNDKKYISIQINFTIMYLM